MTLICPHCGQPLSDRPGGVGCPQGHHFDRARQGYLTLLGPRSRTDTGDSVDMVAAREEFLTAGHYRPLADAVGAAVLAAGIRPDGSARVVEIGAGIGWYLGRLLADLGGAQGLALDSSKPAARRAARVSGVLSVVADAWSVLPVESGSVDVVTSIFAPREGAEVVRVLRPGGLFVAVTPLPEHLAEVRDALGMLTVDEGKADRLVDVLPAALVEVARSAVRTPLTLDRGAAAALVRMGPAARHLTVEEITARAAALPDPASATAAVTVQVFTRT